MQQQPDLPASAMDGKVVEGRGGRLFLAADRNDVLAQHMGELRLTDDQLGRWHSLLDDRAAWLAQQGALYIFMVAPNAHSVYPDQLPADVVAAAERPVHQLIERQRGSAVEPLYPLAELVAHREQCVFPLTGTHWTGLGAFHGYRALLAEIGRSVPVRALSAEVLETTEFPVVGDLGAKLTPARESTWVNVEPPAPAARLVGDNRVRNSGRRIAYEGGGPARDCLVFGDSFAMRMLPLLAESFERLTFAHLATLDRELVRELAPQVVVTETAERMLVQVPCDAEAPTLREVADRKRAAGDVIAPRALSSEPRGPAA